jgi:hypothetical protein
VQIVGDASRATKSASVARRQENGPKTKRELYLSVLEGVKVRSVPRRVRSERQNAVVGGSGQHDTLMSYATTLTDRPVPRCRTDSMTHWSELPSNKSTIICLFLASGVEVSYTSLEYPNNLKDSTKLGSTITSNQQVCRKASSNC